MRGLPAAEGCEGMKRAKNAEKMRRMWCDMILIKSVCIHVWCEIGAQREIGPEIDGAYISVTLEMLKCSSPGFADACCISSSGLTRGDIVSKTLEGIHRYRYRDTLLRAGTARLSYLHK